MYNYDDTFYDYINIGSSKSASVVIPYILSIFDVHSVLDVGCGRGAWLNNWNRNEIENIVGIDGDYVNLNKLLIDGDNFRTLDVSKDFNLNKKFSICECLEVAEHIPEGLSDILVRNLCLHSDVIIFSAASAGQGGENHINEQPYSYWKAKFSLEGYEMFDPIRPLIQNYSTVEIWYKLNIFVFIKRDTPYYSLLNDYRVAQDSDIKDYASFGYKLRKKLVGLLPQRIATFLAVIKKHLIVMKLKIIGLN